MAPYQCVSIRYAREAAFRVSLCLLESALRSVASNMGTGLPDSAAREGQQEHSHYFDGPDKHQNAIISVFFSPDGRYLLSGSFDGTTKMWKIPIPTHRGGSFDGVNSADMIGRLECVLHKGSVLSVAITHEAKWIISATSENGSQLCDPVTGTVQLLGQILDLAVTSVAPSPRGPYFATASSDSTVCIWPHGP